MLAAVKMGAMIVRQAFNPRSVGCKHILAEVLGDDWESKWNSNDKETKLLQRKLVDHIKNSVMDTGKGKFKGASVETLVYSRALENHFIVDEVIMERLQKEDEAHIGAGTSFDQSDDDEQVIWKATDCTSNMLLMYEIRTFLSRCCAPNFCRGWNCIELHRPGFACVK